MKLIQILDRLVLPLFLISVFFIITTFLAFFSQGSEWHRVAGMNIHRVLELLDLREENTLATWFSSMIFFFTSAAFVLLGWGCSPQFTISPLTRWVFRLTAIGACGLAADEVASIHETTGKWAGRLLVDTPVLEDKGFLWVPLLAPVMVIGFLIAAHYLNTILKPLSPPRRQLAQVALVVALICLPLGVFVLELLEARADSPITIFPCFEEAAEIIGMYSLFWSALLAAKEYQL